MMIRPLRPIEYRAAREMRVRMAEVADLESLPLDDRMRVEEMLSTLDQAIIEYESLNWLGRRLPRLGHPRAVVLRTAVERWYDVFEDMLARR